MAIAKTTKPAVKKPVKAPAVKKGKFYYAVLRRLSEPGLIPLEDNAIYGPFDSHESIVEDFKNHGDIDDDGVHLIVFENATVISLKEDRKVVVTKTVL